MIGDTIGSYRIVGKLGEGGMGVVYLAEHPLIGQRAAIKLLHPELSHNRDIVNRFFNEARAATLIKHPSIIGIFDFGYHPSGSAYIAMEYIEGETLAARLRKRRLSPDDALRIARQVANALGAAHAKGIVHRDLKPDNVYLVADPEAAGGERVKILDFGIAKLAGEASTAAVKTRTGSVMGSPAYMAPEQCRGSANVDERADVYALGCVLYEGLAGRPLFTGEGAGEVIAKHIYEPPVPLQAAAPHVPPAIASLVMRCLEKAPDRRFASMPELITAIDWAAAQTGEGRRAPSATPAIPASIMTSSTTLGGTASEIQALHSRKRRGPLIAAVVVAVAGAGVAIAIAIAMTRGGSKPEGVARKPDEPRVVASTTTEPAAPPSSPTPSGNAPTEPATSPVVAPLPPPPPAAPEKIKLAIDSTPSGADVFRAADMIRLGTTPFSQEVDPVDGEAIFIVKLAGHKDRRVTLPANEHGAITVELEKAPSRPKPKPKPKDEYDPFAD